MKTHIATPSEIRTLGLRALRKELGPIMALEFLMQFELGRGDYTSDRRKILGHQSLSDIVSRIKKRRKAQAGGPPFQTGAWIDLDEFAKHARPETRDFDSTRVERLLGRLATEHPDRLCLFGKLHREFLNFSPALSANTRRSRGFEYRSKKNGRRMMTLVVSAAGSDPLILYIHDSHHRLDGLFPNFWPESRYMSATGEWKLVLRPDPMGNLHAELGRPLTQWLPQALVTLQDSAS